MKRNLACVRAEDATEWLAAHDPEDGHGLVGDQAADPDSMFTQPVVIAAWIAGAEKADELAEAEFAIERATGQRQLDEASALIMEAAALFHGYADHHTARADEAERTGDLEAQRASLQKAQVNLSMTVRLREWLAPRPERVEIEDGGIERHYASGGNVHPFGDTRCGLSPSDLAERQGFPPVDDKTAEDCRARFGNIENYGGGWRPPVVPPMLGSNVRPVVDGPLSDPDVVEGLMAGSGMIDATSALSTMKATAFRLQTGDPRFDPQRPVCVNGFLFTPATEA